MVRIAHALCPVDFCEIAQHALDHAAAIARWYEARLTLLYVFANLPTMDLPPLVLEDADRERLATKRRQMAAHVPAEVPVDTCIQEAGYVHEEMPGASCTSWFRSRLAPTAPRIQLSLKVERIARYSGTPPSGSRI